MSNPASPAVDTHSAADCWRRLADCVDALVNAWRGGSRDFSLEDFLPAEPASLRNMALVELVKVDMEQRQADGARFKPLEEYLAEFPELIVDGKAPCDLIYEEFHLRKAAHVPVKLQDYFDRFPNQAEQLARLVENDDVSATTSLTKNIRRPQAPAVGGRLDDFDLLARLGQGAFATVFLARQRSLERLVALKVSEDRGCESQMLAQLDHPNIVRVFDQRRLPAEGLRLMYMQFLPGGTLQSVIRRHNQLPPAARSGATFLTALNEALASHDQAATADSATRRRLQAASWPEVVCWLGARLAAALSYAHEHGVLHRDVKPANVLLGRDGSPKLVDFNISHSSKLDGATPAAYFGGSLAYMSPEQLEACDPAQTRKPEDLDGRSDVYSLAVLLWELLVGQRPFADELAAGDWGRTLSRMTAQRKAGVDPAAIALLPAGAPAGLRETLLAALAGDRETRTASAADFARGLELSLIPRAQRLLGSIGTRRLSARRFPITTLVAAGVVPNVVMSGLNIGYNWNEVVRYLTPTDQGVFYVQLLVVNSIAYAFAVATSLHLCWPVLASLRQQGRQLTAPSDTPHRPVWLRARTLWLGDYAAWICAAAWAFSGFVIPAWIQLQAGADTALTTSHFVHFVASQLLCGLIAASLTFFLVTLAALRACFPRLVGMVAEPKLPPHAAPPLEQRASPAANVVPQPYGSAPESVADLDDSGPASDVVLADGPDSEPTVIAKPGSVLTDGGAPRIPIGASSIEANLEAQRDDDESSDMDQLRGLGQRVWGYFGLAVAAPFLAVMVVVLLNDDRGAIGSLGLVGLVAFGVAFWLALVIRGDVAVLSIAMRPSGGSMSGEEENSHSFWTGSRQ